MHCKQCGAELEAEARFCGECGSTIDNGTPSVPQEVTGPQLRIHPAYGSTYKTGRLISGVISIIGWVVVSSGLLAFIALSEIASKMFNAMPGAHFVPVVVALLLGIFGLILVAFGQWVRAAFDTADFTGELLALMRAKSKS